jgi:alkanesulfonate monooxygenase SsuD/methylene tetrahydromethanopterin reductase-like flavin-dependent oxidoreductase (luciferase family)
VTDARGNEHERTRPLLALEFGLAHHADSGTDGKATYAAALDMISWADERGFERLGLGEYHQSKAGYLPSPLVFAAAAGARTTRIRIRISVLLALLFDPARLAEEVAVADLCTGGRIDLGLGVGEIEDDFDLFGKEYRRRGRDLDELIPFLRRAWTGEPFEVRGQTIRITPRPCQNPMPIHVGGSSRRSIERAALLADGFFSPALQAPWEEYRRVRQAHGMPDPGEWSPRGPMFLWVTTADKRRTWEHLEPYIRRQLDFYGTTASGAKRAPNAFVPTADMENLDQNGAYRVVTPDEAIELATELGPHGELHLSPMLGGIPPADAWTMLETFERDVLPHFD